MDKSYKNSLDGLRGKIVAATARSLNQARALAHAVKGTYQNFRKTIKAARRPVVVISGPAPTNESGLAARDKQLIADEMKDTGWKVIMADRRPRAFLPVKAPIVHVGQKQEGDFKLSRLKRREAVIVVRDRHWSPLEKPYHERKMWGLLPGNLDKTVKFVSYPREAVNELLKMDAERGSVAERSPQAAQKLRRNPARGRRAGRLEATPAPSMHEHRSAGIEPNPPERRR